jgi:hypothetical protein
VIKFLRNQSLVATCVVAAAGWLIACAASPRQRPLNVGPIASGPDSIESVRRLLQGRWTLVSFQTFSAAGEATPQQAVGEMTYDEYGNLLVRGALTGVPSGELAAVLRYSGRAVIDAPNRRLVLQSLQGQGSEGLPAEAAADQWRYYEFDAGLLKLTVKDSAGRPTATVTWKKAQ